MTRFRGCTRCRGPWRGPTKLGATRTIPRFGRIAVRLCHSCIEACREEDVPLWEMLDRLFDGEQERRRPSPHPPTTLQAGLWEPAAVIQEGN